MIKQALIKKYNREGLVYTLLLNIKDFLKRILHINRLIVRKSKIKKYIISHEIKKIQLGCGKSHLTHYLNTDLMGEIPVDITRPLPFKNDYIDLFYSDNLIEHIYNYQFEYHLKEIFRCLKKNGEYVVITPSLEKLIKTVYDKKNKDKEYLFKYHEAKMNIKLNPADFINRFMHINYGHRYLYDLESIKRIAKKIGFSKAIKINIDKIPCPIIKETIKNRPKRWHLVVETFLLTKR